MKTGRWGMDSSNCDFLVAVFLHLAIFIRLADLCGAARLGLGHTGRGRSEQEVWEASGGSCSLAGVVDSEALSEAAHHPKIQKPSI